MEENREKPHLQVLKKTGRVIANDEREHFDEVFWEEVIEDYISLGSIMNPNKKIQKIKYNVPAKRKRFPDFFGDLFGG
jgi:hypothetical protein